MKVREENGSVFISEVNNFSVTQTFDCGQCFRFDVTENRATGYAFGKKVEFFQPADDEIMITPCTASEYESIWRSYLSLDIDYGKIRDELLAFRAEDEKLKTAMKTGSGIRLLRQDKWETLCSFIISQNNNIPRIKKIIAELCRAGAEISGGSETDFPAPETIVKMGEQGLFAIKTGFRAKYLFDAASKVANGEINLTRIAKMPTNEAVAELCKIKGVGPKVAACALLFGFEKHDCFPVDVWVKRVMEEYYGGNVTGSDFGKYAGLAQQYFFYHRRYIERQKNS